MQEEKANGDEAAMTDAELDALAAAAGLALPPGSRDGVRLHLATARRMLAALEPLAADRDELALAPVFRVDDSAQS